MLLLSDVLLTCLSFVLLYHDDSNSMYSEIFMTLTQCCCTDKIKRGDRGHGTKKYREEIKEGVQAGSVDPMALNNSSMNN